jgi:hypothetical protein
MYTVIRIVGKELARVWVAAQVRLEVEKVVRRKKSQTNAGVPSDPCKYYKRSILRLRSIPGPARAFALI